MLGIHRAKSGIFSGVGDTWSYAINTPCSIIRTHIVSTWKHAYLHGQDTPGRISKIHQSAARGAPISAVRIHQPAYVGYTTPRISDISRWSAKLTHSRCQHIPSCIYKVHHSANLRYITPERETHPSSLRGYTYPPMWGTPLGSGTVRPPNSKSVPRRGGRVHVTSPLPKRLGNQPAGKC